MASIAKDQIKRLRDATPQVMKLRLQELEVTQYWGVIFAPEHIGSVTKQDINGFLSYQQNQRWREIAKEDVTVDMDRLRAALRVLVDESRPINERLNRLTPVTGDMAVPYLGKAKLTPILTVTYPFKYGVWNDYSERALTAMGLFPEFSSAKLGDQYALVNEVLVRLSQEYVVSLWWLDIILERIARLVR